VLVQLASGTLRGRSDAAHRRQLLKLIVSLNRLRGIHDRRASGHIDRYSHGLHDFVAGCPLLYRGLSMERDAGVASAGDGNSEGDQFLQTVWKRLSLSGDKSRKLLSAMFGHSGAGCWL
jgi:hypothetical protein